MGHKYRGYSTFEYEKTGSLLLTDIELVKMDLLNHLFTQKGERVMMPDFGTQIRSLVFEPLDDILVDTVREEAEAVFNYDPRVELRELVVKPDYDANAVTISADLFFVEFAVTQNLNLNIQLEEL